MDATRIEPEQRLERLDEHECWRRLLSNQVGRIAFASGGRIEILPLNYVVRDHRLLFRTIEHAALLHADTGPVPFEVDGWDRRIAWSVVVRGRLGTTDDPGALALEQEIGPAPWTPDSEGVRDTFVALTVHEVSGRRFVRRGDEQERWFW